MLRLKQDGNTCTEYAARIPCVLFFNHTDFNQIDLDRQSVNDESNAWIRFSLGVNISIYCLHCKHQNEPAGL